MGVDRSCVIVSDLDLKCDRHVRPRFGASACHALCGRKNLRCNPLPVLAIAALEAAVDAKPHQEDDFPLFVVLVRYSQLADLPSGVTDRSPARSIFEQDRVALPVGVLLKPQTLLDPLFNVARPRLISKLEGLARRLVVVAPRIERPRAERDRQDYSSGSGLATPRARPCRTRV